MLTTSVTQWLEEEWEEIRQTIENVGTSWFGLPRRTVGAEIEPKAPSMWRMSSTRELHLSHWWCLALFSFSQVVILLVLCILLLFSLVYRFFSKEKTFLPQSSINKRIFTKSSMEFKKHYEFRIPNWPNNSKLLGFGFILSKDMFGLHGSFLSLCGFHKKNSKE